MEIEDLYDIAKGKGLEYYGGDGDWYGDPNYAGPEPREIMVKYGSGDGEGEKRTFTDPEEALKFCASLDCGYALWHGIELVIAFIKD
jgi:hypothetical protein